MLPMHRSRLTDLAQRRRLDLEDGSDAPVRRGTQALNRRSHRRVVKRVKDVFKLWAPHGSVSRSQRRCSPPTHFLFALLLALAVERRAPFAAHRVLSTSHTQSGLRFLRLPPSTPQAASSARSGFNLQRYGFVLSSCTLLDLTVSQPLPCAGRFYSESQQRSSTCDLVWGSRPSHLVVERKGEGEGVRMQTITFRLPHLITLTLPLHLFLPGRSRQLPLAHPCRP